MSKKVHGKSRRQVYEMIEKKGKASLRDIRAATGLNYNTIRSAVISLTKAGLIKRIERGVYQTR